MHGLDRAWDEFKREFDSACSQTAKEARHQLTKELNQSFRRILQYRGEDEWISALVDGASIFAPAVALFELTNGTLTLRKQSNFALADDLTFPLASAPAFRSAIESKDSVVTLRSSSEVTESLSELGMNSRAHLFPIANRGRVVAVLFAAGEDVTDANGLELIAGFAAAVLERQSNLDTRERIAPAVEIKKAGDLEGGNNAASAPHSLPLAPPRSLPKWADLDEQAQALHVRAQRFSRVKVAEMQLARPEACQAGRERGNLYLFLKNEIETARDLYRRQFMVIPSMVDYLHLELVRTAAEGDESKLGADYPGQLV